MKAKMRTIPAGKFRNTCLKLMDEVQKNKIPLIVTKRGKPIVQVIPFTEKVGAKSLLGTLIYAAEDIYSTGESWEADS